MLPINLWAVIVAGIAAFILGFLFHSPVSGKLWMKLSNITPTGNEKLKDMIPQMAWNLFVNFITAYVLAIMYLFASTSTYFGITGAWGGVVVGLWVWFGFLITTTSVEVIWMGRSVKLWLFEAVSSLIVMIVMGAIIGAW
jgi:hypothetical protein